MFYLYWLIKLLVSNYVMNFNIEIFIIKGVLINYFNKVENYM